MGSAKDHTRHDLKTCLTDRMGQTASDRGHYLTRTLHIGVGSWGPDLTLGSIDVALNWVSMSEI